MGKTIPQAKAAVGVVGASGYSGELLVQLLLRHPHVDLTCVTSRQHAGKRVGDVIPSLRGVADELVFVDSDAEKLAADDRVDLFFLALPHGVAAGYAQPFVEAGKKVIDLSADFRLTSPEVYQTYYGNKHPNVDLLKRAVYVLPEWTTGWEKTPLAAAPGCYPTGVLLPLLPLMKEKLLPTSGIVISSYSGVSGAGRKVAEDFLFCERAESSKAYGVSGHRHLSEMEEQLSDVAGEKVVLQFIPHLAPMRRGIATTIVAPANGHTVEELYACWEEAYADRPFVTILPSGQTPDTQHVVGSNRLDMSAILDKRTDNFVITSAEDNLMKGAGGQAVQIMNLWLGYPEIAGLL